MALNTQTNVIKNNEEWNYPSDPNYQSEINHMQNYKKINEQKPHVKQITP